MMAKKKGSREDLTGIAFEGNPLGVSSLPGRADKRIVPVPVPTIDFLNPKVERDSGPWSWRNLFSTPKASYKATDTSVRDSSKVTDYFESFNKDTFTDYIVIRVKGRRYAAGSQGDKPLVFKFLINPNTISISRNMIDAQSMTRAGWQVGVWGDDAIDIRLEGVTAGQYFTLGLTNNWAEHSYSYRNFMEFVSLYENNGYWFEGEDIDNSTLANDATRRRIRYHSDIEMRVGNFVWSGCFTDLEFTEDADKPFQLSFSASFMAWKERFLEASPWNDSIHNNTYRGHSFEAQANALKKAKDKKDAEEAAAKKAAADAKIAQDNLESQRRGDPVWNQATIDAARNPSPAPAATSIGSASLAQIQSGGMGWPPIK